MLVKEAMRRQVVQLPAGASIAKGINHLLKFKVNALLIMDEGQRPAGVVSKTDLIGAFYAGLSTDTPLGDVMTGPPLICYPDDELESSLDLMQARGVHRLYVTGAEAASSAGTLSYTDIVALLYRYCRACPKRIAHGAAALPQAEGPQRLSVREVMTRGQGTDHRCAVAFRRRAHPFRHLPGVYARPHHHDRLTRGEHKHICL